MLLVSPVSPPSFFLSSPSLPSVLTVALIEHLVHVVNLVWNKLDVVVDNDSETDILKLELVQRAADCVGDPGKGVAKRASAKNGQDKS